jgi:hypothetical protein
MNNSILVVQERQHARSSFQIILAILVPKSNLRERPYMYIALSSVVLRHSVKLPTVLRGVADGCSSTKKLFERKALHCIVIRPTCSIASLRQTIPTV